jgi:hypothetical protein
MIDYDYQYPMSLTNWIEFVKVDTLFGPGNQFEMIRCPDTPPRIKDIVARFNIFNKDYTTYLTTISNGTLHTINTAMTATVNQGDIYMFVNRNISEPDSRLRTRLYEIYRSLAGTTSMGSNYKPATARRFPYQMPSRGKIFRSL